MHDVELFDILRVCEKYLDSLRCDYNNAYNTDQILYVFAKRKMKKLALHILKTFLYKSK